MAAAKVLPFQRVLAEQLRVFMGRRLDCAQCHNHPYDVWSQDQFWGMTAFFGRTTSTGWLTDQVVFDDPDGPERNRGEMGNEALDFIRVTHPRTKELVEPAFLDGTVLPEDQRRDPRQALAKWVTSRPQFAKAAVNRVWGYFFGKGIVDPVDDFRIANPPTHPDLLEALARDFSEHGFDLKRLMRRILRSRTYQLSSRVNETNQDDEMNYSRALPRPLEAEVLLDAISNVTEVPEGFRVERKASAGYPDHPAEAAGPIHLSVSGYLWAASSNFGAGTRRPANCGTGVTHAGRLHLYRQAFSRGGTCRAAAPKRRVGPRDH